MKNNISFVAQIVCMESGEILSQFRRRVDPNQGIIRSAHEVLNSVISYLEDGRSVSFEINFIVSGFSDSNNKELNIF